MPSRRKTLALLGGGAILAATAGAGAFLATRDPARARAPWAAAGGYADPRKRALSYALLAPSPHNLQPWLADLPAPDTIVLWRDPSRRLPETDPFDRQMTIGMGCFLETLAVAASHDGLSAGVALFPDGEAGPTARITLREGAEPDPLFAQIPHRRSVKAPFAPDPVPPEAVQALAGLADIHTAPGIVAALRDLTWRAWLIEAGIARTHGESVDLMRLGRREIEASPDGIDLGGPFLESLMLAGVLSRDAQRDPTSRAYATGVGIYREMLAATPAYAALTTAGNARIDQIAAGRAWVRLNLTATALGLALHPVSQTLQEFAEMAGPFAEAHALLAHAGGTVQMLGRLGFGPEVPPSPRWPLEAKLTDDFTGQSRG